MSRGRGFLRELHENRDSLLRYSTLTSPDHIITAQELEEYKQAQRELMIYENVSCKCLNIQFNNSFLHLQTNSFS